MAKNSFDQFSKQLLEQVLEPLGTVETSHEVSGEPQFVDVYFVPSSKSRISPEALGLLGRIAQAPCLIEPFHNQPTMVEVRSCLLKLFQVQGNYLRQSKRDQETLAEVDFPSLWILASSASDALLERFGAISDEAWPAGIYFLPLALKTGMIAINRLPEASDTLWLRLLGKGKTQQRAIAEVLAFERQDPRRSDILRLLANWKISVEVTREFEAQDEELMMALSQAYLEWEQQTEQRGLERGIEQERSLVLRQLNRRVGLIAPETETQIRALSLTQLEDLGEALLDFSQPSDLYDWLRALGS